MVKGVIVGVDEVGRGPAAGPVTVAAVVLPERCRIRGLNDSKLLSGADRQCLAREIKRVAVAIGVGWAGHDYIDEHGLTAALNLAGGRALAQIKLPVDIILLDGIHDYLIYDVHTECMVKADQKVKCVAAASIVAKVARDNYMQLAHRQFPNYGFNQHKGYLSSEHLLAIEQYGPSPIHRLRWKTFASLTDNL
jgi:ribonuclease HII